MIPIDAYISQESPIDYLNTTSPTEVVREAVGPEDPINRTRPDLSLNVGSFFGEKYLGGALGTDIRFSPEISVTGTLMFGMKGKSSSTYTTTPSPFTGIYGQITRDKVNSTRLGLGADVNLGSEELYVSVGGRFFKDASEEELTEKILKGDTVLNSTNSSTSLNRTSGGFYVGMGTKISDFELDIGLVVKPGEGTAFGEIRGSYNGLQISSRNRESKR